jgi:hypothetical protein
MALRGVQTSHFFYADIEFWASEKTFLCRPSHGLYEETDGLGPQDGTCDSCLSNVALVYGRPRLSRGKYSANAVSQRRLDGFGERKQGVFDPTNHIEEVEDESKEDKPVDIYMDNRSAVDTSITFKNTKNARHIRRIFHVMKQGIQYEWHTLVSWNTLSRIPVLSMQLVVFVCS